MLLKGGTCHYRGSACAQRNRTCVPKHFGAQARRMTLDTKNSAFNSDYGFSLCPLWLRGVLRDHFRIQLLLYPLSDHKLGAPMKLNMAT